MLRSSSRSSSPGCQSRAAAAVRPFGRGGELTDLNPLHLTGSANTELSIANSYPQCQQTFTYGYGELATLKVMPCNVLACNVM